MSNLKPFSLPEALSGKAVMLRDGGKAYVRHHETELDVPDHNKLVGYCDASWLVWREDGDYFKKGVRSKYDIIGMYPETRVINGFAVPAPQTEELEYGTPYYLASSEARHFHNCAIWDDHEMDKLWLERGLAFLNAEDAIATAKAMLGIDPNSKDES